jgi:hypothetical protein
VTLQAFLPCRWLESLVVGVTCTASPWATFLGGLVGIAVAIAGLWLLTRQQWRRRNNAAQDLPIGLPAAAAGLATIVAGLSLGAAAGAPEYRPTMARTELHVIVLVDASESATREIAGWRTQLKEAARALAPIAGQTEARGSLILFGSTVRVDAESVPLAALLQRLPDTRPLEGQDADATAPRRALQRALQIARAKPIPARLLVVSDGLWTESAPAAEVREAAALGLRIDVVPIEAAPAKLGIVSGHLPIVVDSGANVPTRLVIAGMDDETVELNFNRNRGQASPSQAAILGRDPRQVRADQTFDGRGVQFVETALRRANGKRQVLRFYTTVLAPPRIVVLGAAPWVDRLPRDRFQIMRRDPRAALDLSDTDVVVIDNLARNELHPDTPARIASAVTHDGLGLFFVNGPMRGTPKDETVIGTYRKTPLEGILPVSPDRDLIKVDPPPRTIGIVIDSSGSMAGNSIVIAKKIASDIIGRMRDKDYIVIDSFPQKGTPIRSPLRMAPDGRRRALDFVAGLSAGGGSNEAPGISLIQSLPSSNCAAFLFSDGDVESQVEFAPGCSFNYVEIQYGNDRYASRSAHLRKSAAKNGNHYSVSDRISDPPRFEFRFLDPPPEEINFRNQTFTPGSRRTDPALAPRLATNGVAITFARPESEMYLFRDAFPADPVLAFRPQLADPRHGETGAFLGALEGAWLGPSAIAALAQHLERLSGWQQRDRMQVEMQEIAGRVRLRLTPLGDRATRPSLASTSAVIDLFGKPSIAVNRLSGADDAASFEGVFELPEGDPGVALRGQLRLNLGTRSERIPMLLPAVSPSEARQTLEAYTHGQDRASLEALVRPTQGRVLAPQERLEGDFTPRPPPPVPLHAWLLTLGAFACLLAFVGRQAKP